MNIHLDEERVRGPNPRTGYFSSESDPETKDFPNAVSIEACERDFKSTMRQFSKAAILYLKQTLGAEEVNGSFSHTDLYGTLAKFYQATPEALCAQIGHRRSVYNSVEYWFRQIGGWRTVSPDGKPPEKKDRCLFTEIAMRWCDELIAEEDPKSQPKPG